MATFKQYTDKKGNNKWKFQVYLGVDYVTGKEIRTTRRGFETKKKAQKKLNELLVEFENKGQLKSNVTLFKEVYELWFKNYERSVKESTKLMTKKHFEKHILPIFGDLKLERITMKYCQTVVNDWYDSVSMARLLVSYTSKVFDYAITLEVMESNPTKHVLRPVQKKKTKRSIKFYTRGQLERFLAYLDDEISLAEGDLSRSYTRELDRTIFRLLAFSGIRVSEALALSWNDFNSEDNTISISKTLSQSEKGYVLSTPKTERSNRSVLLDEKTAHTLKRWRLKQREMMLAHGKRSIKSIFCRLDGSYMIRTDVYHRSKKIASACELPFIGCHGFRHTHASLLFETKQVSLKHIQHRLGHTDIQITANIYTHITNEDDKMIVDSLTKHANF